MKIFKSLCLTPLTSILLLGPALLFTAGTTAGGQNQNSTSVSSASESQVPVVFSGGHETEPKDRGRPVILIAAALGVPSEVFREAFRHVHPAPAGTEPDPQQARDNKTALMTALNRYEVTNERLDTVSNYYRYVRSRNALWPTKPAAAYAVIQDGVITKFVVTSGGSGYSSPPIVSVPGVLGASGQAQLTFSRSFDKNGAVGSITVTPRKKEVKSRDVCSPVA